MTGGLEIETLTVDGTYLRHCSIQAPYFGSFKSVNMFLGIAWDRKALTYKGTGVLSFFFPIQKHLNIISICIFRVTMK
jgi:hypothetical protein